jgi:hypothetical protein
MKKILIAASLILSTVSAVAAMPNENDLILRATLASKTQLQAEYAQLGSDLYVGVYSRTLKSAAIAKIILGVNLFDSKTREVTTVGIRHCATVSFDQNGEIQSLSIEKGSVEELACN